MSSRFRRPAVLWSLMALGVVCWVAVFASQGVAQDAVFVGSAACADCHPEQYENFNAYSKKAKSWESVEVMRSNLQPDEVRECYECHTTGYGQPGGFVSHEETPELAHVGCETCHGPGSVHTEYGEADAIVLVPTMESCMVCHNESRVQSFNFKPLIYSGAH